MCPMAEMIGYKMKTTFWEDFSIADAFGKSAIKDTFNRAFNNWKTNTEFVTELTLVLNWKIWQWYETNEDMARFYNGLWEKVDNWCIGNLKGEDLDYFLEVTD